MKYGWILGIGIGVGLVTAGAACGQDYEIRFTPTPRSGEGISGVEAPDLTAGSGTLTNVDGEKNTTTEKVKAPTISSTPPPNQAKNKADIKLEFVTPIRPDPDGFTFRVKQTKTWPGVCVWKVSSPQMSFPGPFIVPANQLQSEELRGQFKKVLKETEVHLKFKWGQCYTGVFVRPKKRK